MALGVGTVACATEAEEDPVAAAGPPAAAGPGATTTDDGADTDAPDTGTLAWTDCGGGNECAELDVPVDYDDPDVDTLTLGIARVPAGGDRIGALFVNPGGPGVAASDYAVGLAASLPPEVTEHFDIVGVDPRGLGPSAIDCGGDFVDLYSVDYSIDSPDDEETLLDVSQDYVDGCDAAAGDLLPHLGTQDVARDHDAVRAAMGDEQANFLMYSYGTAIAQEYAELFPERVRSMVIDGVLELGPSGIENATDQALGFESALDAFVADCNDDESCAIAPDAEGAVDQLMAAVEEEEIPASPRDLGPGDLVLGMADALYSESLWPDLARATADALDGDGTTMVALTDDYLSTGTFDVYFAVNCIDFTWPDSTEELLADGRDVGEQAPHFGESLVNDYVRCPIWPAEGEPLDEVTATGTPPILVVGTTNDPATPYAAAQRTAERLDDGVLLTYEGEGHGVVASGVSCIDDAVATYIVDLEPPPEGTTC
ncbi:MAG TPA: alpha/beta hydrolase [Acidimicrobiales bacterium]|nr:alpha/beta hydrolase [Acidimicrobiales bacterium]